MVPHIGISRFVTGPNLYGHRHYRADLNNGTQQWRTNGAGRQLRLISISNGGPNLDWHLDFPEDGKLTLDTYGNFVHWGHNIQPCVSRLRLIHFLLGSGCFSCFSTH